MNTHFHQTEHWTFRTVQAGHVIVIDAYPLQKHLGGVATGVAAKAPEDPYDIRVGVPLALKRALSQVKNANRKEAQREFFRAWPESHPEYRRKSSTIYRPQAGDPILRMTVVRGEGGPTGEVIRVTKIETVPYEPPPDSRPLTDCPKCSLKVAVGETCAFCETVESPQFRCL